LRQRSAATRPPDYEGDECNSSSLIEKTTESPRRKEQTSDTDAEIFNIALPTLATLAANPLAELVSTAWVGHIGAVELAGVGVALSVYGAFTKLFNMPLLAVITSSTAAAVGRDRDEDRPSEISSTVTSGLALALGVGAFQTLLLGVFGIYGLSIWGAGQESPLHSAATDYLAVRAASAPATIAFLGLQGIFRGLGDAKAPLAATVLSNAINVVLEPLFIFHFGWGVKGAAGAITMAHIVSSAVLAAMLTRRMRFRFHSRLSASEGGVRRALSGAWEYVKPTGLLTVRTLAIIAVFAVATGLAARTDGAHAAAHQIAFQLWLASSLLADSLAVAAQSLIARSLASGTEQGRGIASEVVTRVTNLSLWLGAVLAAGLTVGTYALPLPMLFSSDPDVLRTLSCLLPAVIATQPINSLAFTLDGILYGVRGFGFAAMSMVLAAAPSIAVMLLGAHFAAAAGLRADGQLFAVWGGLALLMTLRLATIYGPLQSRRPPFDQLS